MKRGEETMYEKKKEKEKDNGQSESRYNYDDTHRIRHSSDCRSV